MLHSTKGIVLRSIKYGDTSLVVTIYTELFGIQSYIINGARTTKKTANKANLYQSFTLLEMIVYHSPNKNLQRIKEARIYHLYENVYHSFVKNAIGIYLTELIYKSISEPETNQELFLFFENAFLQIDLQTDELLANFPIEFTLDLARYLGFGIQNKYSNLNSYFDFLEGKFCDLNELKSLQFIQGDMAEAISNIDSHEPVQHDLNQTKRRALLRYALQYLQLHITNLGELKSVKVLNDLMDV